MNTSLETLTCFEFPNAETAVVKEPLLEEIEAACEQACQSIAPAWPLDRAIAVNPHWCRIGRPVREVAARMAVLGDIRVFPPEAMCSKPGAKDVSNRRTCTTH